MNHLNIHDFIPQSRANGPGVRAVVWVQGCPRRCLGCFNPDTQMFTDKNIINVNDLRKQILAIHGISGVTFSGGEPFSQAKPLAILAQALRQSGLTIVCYTGYTLKQLHQKDCKNWNALLAQIDMLIDGPFLQHARCHEPYRGSTNQKIHFLSDRIKPENSVKNQTAEFILSTDGSLMQTGFPDILDLNSEIQITF